MRILFAGSNEAFRHRHSGAGQDLLPCLFFIPEFINFAELDNPTELAADVCIMPLQQFLRLKAENPERRFMLPLVVSGPVSGMQEAFAWGCADYLVEPWSGGEALARCRRCASLTIGTVSLQLQDGSLHGRKRSLQLSPTELKILRLLLANRHLGCSKTALAEVLGQTDGGRATDMSISRLRKSLRSCDPANPVTILRCQKGLYQIATPTY